MPIPTFGAGPPVSKTLPTQVLRAGSPATKTERDAAARLGMVYGKLAGRRETPLGRWAIVSDNWKTNINYRPFNEVLGEVYGSDFDRTAGAFPGKAPSRVALYKKDCDTIFTGIVESTLAYALLAISAQASALTTLLSRVKNEKGIADRLHKASEEIVAALRREMRKEEYAQKEVPPPPDNEPLPPLGYVSPLSQADVRRIVRERVVKMVPYAGDDVLSILFEHPDGLKILGAYAESGQKGTLAASTRIAQAIEALEGFAVEAIDKKHALRYPFFVIGAVVQRNLRDVPGFTECAINLAQVTVRDRQEAALTFAGVAIGILALIISGPSAPLLFAGVLLAGADLALAGMNVGVVFAREREQDLAYRSTQFKAEADRWATPVVYQDTILAGAAALLSGIAVLKTARELHAVLNAPAKGRVAATPAGRAGPGGEGQRLTAPENRIADGQPSRVSRGADNASTEKPLVDRPASADQAASLSREVQQPKTSKDLEWRGPAQGDEAIELAGAKTPVVVDEANAAGPAQRLTKRPVEAPPGPPAREKVPLRDFLDNERASLDAEILRKEQEIAAHNAELAPVREKVNAAAARRNLARKAARTPEDFRRVAELEAEYERLRDEFNSFDLPSLSDEKLALKALRSRNTTEYFDALTAAASGKPEYAAVAGKLDAVFRPFDGALSREHVMARSAMFQTPGFIDKIIWEQQIFLFNLKKNLKVAPAAFNSARGAASYTQLGRGARSFIRDDQALADLIALEREVERDVEKLLAKPRDPTLWGEYGYKGPFK